MEYEIAIRTIDAPSDTDLESITHSKLLSKVILLNSTYNSFQETRQKVKDTSEIAMGSRFRGLDFTVTAGDGGGG